MYHLAKAAGYWFVVKDSTTNPHSNHEYFAGYDEMGSVIWEKLFSFDQALTGKEEAEQIIKDLQAAE